MDTRFQFVEVESLEPRLLMAVNPVQLAFPAALTQAITVLPADSTSVSGDIALTGETDLYRITAPADGKIVIDLSAQGGLNGYLKVYNSKGAITHSSTTLTANKLVTFKVVGGAVYYLQTSGVRNTTGHYSMTVLSQPTDDYGNTFAAAKAVTIGRTGKAAVNGKVNYSGDQDVFSLVAKTTGRLKLDLGEIKKALRSNCQFSIYDAQQHLLATVSDPTVSGTIVAATAGQRIYVVVQGIGSATSSYGLTVLNDSQNPPAPPTPPAPPPPDGGGGSGGGGVVPGPTPDPTPAPKPLFPIYFPDHTLVSYGSNQDKAGQPSFSADGGSVLLSGNCWKSMDLSYSVTPYTVLEFDFKVNSAGAIQGIGLDENNALSWNRVFQLAGSQDWGIEDFAKLATPGQWVHYTIKVGDFYRGQMSRLVFACDDDANAAASGNYSNIKLYESAPSTPAPSNLLYTLSQTAGIRAGYFGPNQLSLLPTMKAAGINTVIMKYDVQTPMAPAWTNTYTSFAAEAHKNGMAYVPMLNFSGSAMQTLPQYRKYVDANGNVSPDVPCPSDEGLWMNYMAPRVAELVKFAPDAVGIDFEMYTASGTDHYLDACYCDSCLKSFAASANLDATNLGALRQQISTQKDLKASYVAFQTSQIEAYVQYLRTDVVPAGIAIAAFQVDWSAFRGSDIPFYNALAIGLGTQEQPMIDMSESIYYGRSYLEANWQDYVTKAAGYMEQIGAHVIPVYGVQQRAFTPDQLAVDLAGYAHASGGFWVFTLQDFLPEYSSNLKGPTADYIQAIAKASTTLDTLLGDTDATWKDLVTIV